MAYKPNFPTYNEHYLTLDHYFGLHEHMICTKVSFRQAGKTAIELVMVEHYNDMPEILWENALYDGNKIVRMFVKGNMFAIITRNEKSNQHGINNHSN